MPNRLANEISPYLLQHANNPVDWYPWCDEALKLASRLDRPIFLSIGYSACHWCHVMEHESFENDSIAAMLNENFVSIKVDREERPDLDQIYMQAVMALRGGQGGWPLSAFLTPTQEVFFGGTYWPPTSRGGMPGFDHVLSQVLRAYRDQNEQVRQQASQLSAYLQNAMSLTERAGLDEQLLIDAVQALDKAFDSTHGGFGSTPKFPHPMDLQLLIRLHDRWPADIAIGKSRIREMIATTLQRMAEGGIYDHLGGGFARYSVDREWLVPHFEKMLYDNALLSRTYLAAYSRWGNADDKQTVCETLDYILRDMRDPKGGIHSTEDADSEGVEGKFYVWTPDEIRAAIDEPVASLFCEYYDVTVQGNFENGQSILHPHADLTTLAASNDWTAEQLEKAFRSARERLVEIRNQRVRPGKDDKIIVCWNGLMIDVLARGAGVLRRPKYLEAAVECAEFILAELRGDDGRLVHGWRQGQPRQNGFLDDYAALIGGLVTLYESTFDERWIDAAVGLAETLLKHFHDPALGGFYYVADDHESLIARGKDWQDASIPSGNAMAVTALLRLGKLTVRDDFEKAAEDTLQLLLGQIRKAPMAGGQSLISLDLIKGGLSEWVVVLPAEGEWNDVLQALHDSPISRRVVSVRREGDTEGRSSCLDALHQERRAIDGKPTLFVCENRVCREPQVGAKRVVEELKRMVEDVVPIQTAPGDKT